MRVVELAPGQVRLAEAPVPEPGPGWGLVRVLACGLCGTDLRFAHGAVLPRGLEYPLRPGHEVAGVLESAAGPLPPGLSLGSMVVLHPLTPCGRCRACLAGHEQRCPTGRVIGMHDPGGMAEAIIWPLARMLAVPGIPAPQAAILSDAGATAHHALRLAAVPTGGRLCVIGAGGVGEQVLRLARALSPAVTLAAVVKSEASARRVAALGAHAVAGLAGVGHRLRDEMGSFDAVVDFSGAAGAAAEALSMLGAGGRLVVGSTRDEPLDLGTTITAFAAREFQVLGCYISTLADLRSVLRLAASGRLDLSGAVTEVFPLAKTPEVFERLEQHREGAARLVLEP